MSSPTPERLNELEQLTRLTDEVLREALEKLIDGYANPCERARAVLVAALGPLVEENERLRRMVLDAAVSRVTPESPYDASTPRPVEPPVDDLCGATDGHLFCTMLKGHKGDSHVARVGHYGRFLKAWPVAPPISPPVSHTP